MNNKVIMKVPGITMNTRWPCTRKSINRMASHCDTLISGYWLSDKAIIQQAVIIIYKRCKFVSVLEIKQTKPTRYIILERYLNVWAKLILLSSTILRLLPSIR